jgi:hypothetical protein
MTHRTTETVLRDHLDRALRGDLDGDIDENFAPDIVLLTTYGTFRGFQGIRAAAKLLNDQLGSTSYEYTNVVSEGDVGFLEWRAETPRARVTDGADTFIVRDGKIRTMTIHYTVEPIDAGSAGYTPHNVGGDG